MGSSPFRSIFLPSLVTSGLAFAVITLPLSMANSVPTWVAPGQVRGELISPLDNSAKPVIRYIGIAIIGSVGAGMITADILRRFYRRRRSLSATPVPFETSTASARETSASYTDFDQQMPSAAVGSSTALNGQSLLAKDLAPGQTIVHFKGYTHNGNVDGLELAPIALDELMRLDEDSISAEIPVLTFLEQVAPPHLESGNAVVFGVRYQNKYYCLWRTTEDQDRAIGWARRLIRQHRDVIVTQNSQTNYSLWYVPPKQLR